MRTFFKHQLPGMLVILWLAVSMMACSPRYAISTTHTPVMLGNITVDIVLHESASPGLTYFNLHDNENTSVQAAIDVIGEYGGRVIELKHSGNRNIQFQLGDSTYEFDPNRMFTEHGRAATLEKFGNVSDEALDSVGTFAAEVLRLLDPAGLDVLVTLHNTDRYSSIQIYAAGGKYETDAKSVNVSEEMDQNDFYFVTQQETFQWLKDLDQNVVLQDNVNVTDDGSLSVWSAQQDLTYVNVEAQNGHRRIQRIMIQRLHEYFLSNR